MMYGKRFRGLLNSSQHGLPDKVRGILEDPDCTDLDPNGHDEGGATPLIRCVQGMLHCSTEVTERRLEVARLLIKHGAQFDALDGCGRNALQWAVFVRSAAMVEELLQLGADPASYSDRGHTAIHFAVKASALEMLASLVKYGPDKIVDVPNQVGSSALSYAAQNGDLEACHVLLDLGANVNAQDVLRPQRTPLHYAIANEKYSIFKLLLRHGAIPTIPDYRQRRVLHQAAVASDPRFLKVLCVTFSVSIMETENEEGATALMLACQKEAGDQVEALLKKKVDLTAQDLSGKTALHYCAESAHVGLAEKLLQADASLLEVKDFDGYSPLQLAVIGGNGVMAEFLIRSGADVHSRDNEEHTLAHWATVCGHLEVIDILAEHGADLSQPDVHEAYPVHYAAQMCGAKSEETTPEHGLKMLRKLISKGVPVNVTDRDHRQPLLWAASAGSGEACDILLNAGADINAHDNDGLTALHCAASRGYDECVNVFHEQKGQIDSTDKNGCTPLFYALTLDHRQCAAVLLQKGANPSHRDKRGRTPAHCAAAKGALDSLKMLVNHHGNLWLANNKGEFPIHEACLAKHNDTVGFLVDENDDKSKVNITNNDGRTCLHIAALTNNLDLCKLLVSREADPKSLMEGKGKNTVPKYGERQLTPYDAALLKGSQECAEYLRAVIMEQEKKSQEEKEEEKEIVFAENVADEDNKGALREELEPESKEEHEVEAGEEDKEPETEDANEPAQDDKEIEPQEEEIVLQETEEESAKQGKDAEEAAAEAEQGSPDEVDPEDRQDADAENGNSDSKDSGESGVKDADNEQQIALHAATVAVAASDGHAITKDRSSPDMQEGGDQAQPSEEGRPDSRKSEQHESAKDNDQTYSDETTSDKENLSSPEPVSPRKTESSGPPAGQKPAPAVTKPGTSADTAKSTDQSQANESKDGSELGQDEELQAAAGAADGEDEEEGHQDRADTGYDSEGNEKQEGENSSSSSGVPLAAVKEDQPESVNESATKPVKSSEQKPPVLMHPPLPKSKRAKQKPLKSPREVPVVDNKDTKVQNGSDDACQDSPRHSEKSLRSDDHSSEAKSDSTQKTDSSKASPRTRRPATSSDPEAHKIRGNSHTRPRTEPHQKDSRKNAAELRRVKRHVLRLASKKNYKHEIQELVRIFECKTLASSTINKSRKLQLYNTYRGYMPEKHLVKELQSEYNGRARDPIIEAVRSTEEWEGHLQDVLHQASVDEKALKMGWKSMESLSGEEETEREREGKLKEFDLRYTTVPSPQDNEASPAEPELPQQHGSPHKSPRHGGLRRENSQLVWDRRRRTAWEMMQEDKLLSAYGAVQSPRELALLSQHGSRPETEQDGCFLPLVADGTKGRSSKGHSRSQDSSGSSSNHSESSNTLPSIHHGGKSKTRSSKNTRSYSAANSTKKQTSKEQDNLVLRRSKTTGVSSSSGASSKGSESRWTPKYDGQLRPRRQLVFMPPDLYRKKHESEKLLKKRYNRDELLVMLSELLDVEQAS